MCVTGEGSDARFAIVTTSTGAATCTARGRLERTGSALRLLIDGDPACSLSATSMASGLTLTAATGAGMSLSDVQIARPDLESVFLHLTGKALRD